MPPTQRTSFSLATFVNCPKQFEAVTSFYAENQETNHRLILQEQGQSEFSPLSVQSQETVRHSAKTLELVSFQKSHDLPTPISQSNWTTMTFNNFIKEANEQTHSRCLWVFENLFVEFSSLIHVVECVSGTPGYWAVLEAQGRYSWLLGCEAQGRYSWLLGCEAQGSSTNYALASQGEQNISE